MTTRLDRLFVLLDTGSTPLIRKSAAEQLGDVQRLHSYDLDVLLEKVHNYLCSTNWDTRVAAGYALASIAKNVPTLSSHCAQNTVQDDISSVHLASVYMFSKFNIQHVLNCGSFLLGCEGSQYDINMKNSGFDDNERMSSQRTLLNKHLGLDFANGMGIDSPEFFKDEDLKLNFHQRTPLSSPTQSQYPADTVEQQMLSVKSACQQSDYSTVGEGVLSDTFSPSKRLKLNHDDEEKQKLVIDIEKSSQHTDQLVKSWPFQYFCDVLMNELFHASWEVRHGAATGLREIIKQHGMHAGKTKSITGCLCGCAVSDAQNVDACVSQSISANQTWLSDAAIRLLCVLALDRFGDFVSDEVVAPVRETCSQTIGVIAGRLTAPGVQRMLDVVLQLCSQHQWEVRHGGMLSLKYILAVRQDLTGALLPMLMPVVLRGLQDSDDDVRAVSAATLIPVADKVFSILSEQVPMMLSCLWNVLLDLDDLTASTNSIMTLLSLLLSPTSATAIDSEVGCLTDLVPRLWPFLRHSLVTARRSAFQTLLALLSSTSSCQERCWVIPILQDTLRHVYQRSLLETQPEVLDLIERVWSALLQSVPAAYLVGTATPWLGVWLCLLMQPATISYDSGYLIEARHRVKECYSGKQNLGSEGRRMIAADVEQRDYIGGGVCSSDADDVDIIMRARLTGARLLGILASYLTQSDIELPVEMTETPIVSLSKLFLFHLNTKSAMQRLVVAQVIFYWARQPKPCLCQESVKMRMIECLGETVYFDEIAIAFTRMQTDVRDFLACLKQEDVNLDAVFSPNAIVSLDQAMHLVLDVYDEVKIRLRPRVTSSFEERRKQLHYVVSTTNNDQQTLSIRVLASLAMAVVQLNLLPEKLNPIIRPIMDAIKKEENLELRHQAAESLSAVMKQCLVHSPNPNSKIIKNLVMYLCCDASVTPSVSYPVPQKPTDVFSLEIPCDMECGIITLANLQKASDLARKRVHRSPTVSEAGKLPGCSALPSSKAVLSLPDQSQLIDENEARQQHIIQRLGSEAALLSICRQFGEAMPQHLPDLWQLCNLPLLKCQPNSEKVTEDDQQLVNALQLLETISSNLHIDLLNQMLDRLSHLSSLLNHKRTSVRHMACRVVVAFAIQKMVPVMSFFIEHVVPGLENLLDVRLRQGVCETLTNLVDQLGVRLCPFLVLIMMPVLGRMVDPDPSVRMVASHCFAALVSLMPLESGFADPPDMLPALTARRKQERDFIDQLLDPSKLQPFSVDVQIHANLRKYQLDGVSWLTFLNKYRLHGILCDDMGLGKTLQCLCLLASHHYHQRINSPDDKPLPSLVVCPSTLLGHWVYETKKFVDVQYLSPLMYSGLPVERSRLQRQVKSHNLIIASYEVVRNDIDFFSAQRWSYCILDEGHVIRNGKTKLSKATKQLICQHRLILSGTPIQNNVHDLWSLFDFLMPGFLGTEKQFYTSYGKPIFMSREAKSSSKEQEAGVLAMERLHRQVLPFILRRLKEDVLSDLPQKIIQDYYCDLSPLQVELYEDFAQSSVRSDVEESVSCFIGSGKDGVKATSRSTSSIFQALHYLRKVCNHPALVLTPSHPKHSEIVNRLTQQRISLHHLNHSPKLIALRQLLLDCGIGIDDWHASSACSANTDLPLDSGRPVVGQHRVLVFCQLRGMLDIVEKDLLRVHMPSVTYLRLDGSVPPADRHSVVHRFNNDPSIDVLLLTTHIGGLGLNLTGADTVIFMEHDWNPMKDLQAMDRAHRIGQKKVVNVYRLISRGTLEEKIMSLQKFKMAIANTVIGEENSSMKSMGTDQLFDLFALDHSNINAKIAAGSDDGLSKVSSRVSTMMESLEELWDEKQYTDEYDIDNFIASLSASSHT